MYLTGIGTAVPQHRYTQADCWAAMQRAPQFPRLNPRSHALLRKVLCGDNGIDARYLAIEDLDQAFVDPGPSARPVRRARPGARHEAAERALASANGPVGGGRDPDQHLYGLPVPWADVVRESAAWSA